MNRVAPKYTTNMIKLIGKTQNKRKRTITREMNFAINCAQNRTTFVKNPRKKNTRECDCGSIGKINDDDNDEEEENPL